MDIPKINLGDNETGCCPRFHPEEWHNQVIRMNKIPFVKAKSRSFMYMPLNLGKVMTKTMKAIESEDAMPKDRYLVLSKDLSPWKCEHYFMVSKPLQKLNTDHITGEFYLRTYDGPYKNMPHWIDAFKKEANEQGYHLKDIFYFYTTCPKCAEVYGHNYVVLFGKI